MFFNEELYGFTFFAPLGESNLAAFPSGHTCSILALTTALGILKPPLRLPLLLIGCLIASARVIVAAHYPTDVIAGISLGIWSAHLTHRLLRNRLQSTAQPEIIIKTQREAA
jgi:undecaprenyl-diphosphatase